MLDAPAHGSADPDPPAGVIVGTGGPLPHPLALRHLGPPRLRLRAVGHRQDHLPRRPDPPLLAPLGHRPRHQVGALAADLRLPRERPRQRLPALRPGLDRRRRRPLQPPLRDPARRAATWPRRRPRRHPRRPREGPRRRRLLPPGGPRPPGRHDAPDLYAERDKTLAGCGRLPPPSGAVPAAEARRMLATHHDPDLSLGWIFEGRRTPTHPAVRDAAATLLNMEERTASGVFAQMQNPLSLLRDPDVARSTETSDFTAADLVNGDRPVSLYLTIAPSDLGRLRDLLRLVISQLLRHLTAPTLARAAAAPPPPRRVHGARPARHPPRRRRLPPRLRHPGLHLHPVALAALRGLRRAPEHLLQLRRPDRLRRQRPDDGPAALGDDRDDDRRVRSAEHLRGRPRPGPGDRQPRARPAPAPQPGRDPPPARGTRRSSSSPGTSPCAGCACRTTAIRTSPLTRACRPRRVGPTSSVTSGRPGRSGRPTSPATPFTGSPRSRARLHASGRPGSAGPGRPLPPSPAPGGSHTLVARLGVGAGPSSPEPEPPPSGLASPPRLRSSLTSST